MSITSCTLCNITVLFMKSDKELSLSVVNKVLLLFFLNSDVLKARHGLQRKTRVLSNPGPRPAKIQFSVRLKPV